MNFKTYLALLLSAVAAIVAVWGTQYFQRPVKAPEVTYGTVAPEASRASQFRFIQGLVPSVAQVNHHLSMLRDRLDDLYAQWRQDGTVSEDDRRWLAQLEDDFLIARGNQVNWPELFNRVDTIPPELILAQAVLASGWGQLPAAQTTINYYGLRCVQTGCGVRIQPENGAPGWLLQRFSNPLEGTSAYMRELNTGPEHALLRQMRAQIRYAGREPQAEELLPALLNYGNHNAGYVTQLSRTLNQNRALFETNYTLALSSRHEPRS